MACSSDSYLPLAHFQIYWEVLLQFQNNGPLSLHQKKKKADKIQSGLTGNWRYGGSYPLGIIFNNPNQLQNKAQKMSALFMKGLLKKPS